MPPTSRINAVNTPTVPGTANWRCRFGIEARRQAMSGPMTMNTKLLNRKLASRLTIDSSRASAVSNGSRLAYSAKLATPETIRNARKKYPTLDWVNECTLEITPERVMNVPKIDNSHDPMIRARFHFFNIPRFSWIITEWRNAVIVSHGRSDAFSTGSHAQYPPHPSST